MFATATELALKNIVQTFGAELLPPDHPSKTLKAFYEDQREDVGSIVFSSEDQKVLEIFNEACDLGVTIEETGLVFLPGLQGKLEKKAQEMFDVFERDEEGRLQLNKSLFELVTIYYRYLGYLREKEYTYHTYGRAFGPPKKDIDKIDERRRELELALDAYRKGRGLSGEDPLRDSTISGSTEAPPDGGEHSLGGSVASSSGEGLDRQDAPSFESGSVAPPVFLGEPSAEGGPVIPELRPKDLEDLPGVLVEELREGGIVRSASRESFTSCVDEKEFSEASLGSTRNARPAFLEDEAATALRPRASLGAPAAGTQKLPPPRWILCGAIRDSARRMKQADWYHQERWARLLQRLDDADDDDGACCDLIQKQIDAKRVTPRNPVERLFHRASWLFTFFKPDFKPEDSEWSHRGDDDHYGEDLEKLKKQLNAFK